MRSIRGSNGEPRIPNPESRQPAEFWRTLDERADDPAFQEHLYNEFPSEIEAITDPVARRTFLKLMGASMALAGVTACTRQPTEKIVPYVRQPEELIPGKPLFFATAMPLGGTATGLLVESHEGRPTKIEGNPLHPSSLGATDVFAQAAILGPVRSRSLADADQPRRDSSVAGLSWRDPRGADGAAAAQRRRHPYADRVDQFADAGGADPRGARAIPVREMASVGSRRPRERTRRREARVRRGRRRAVPPRAGRRHPVARRRLPRLRTRRAALRAGIRRTAASRAGRSHEPALRRGEHADLHRGARRPSPAAETERDRGARAPDRSRAWRRAGRACPPTCPPERVARRRKRAARSWMGRTQSRSGSAPSPRTCSPTAGAASSSPATAQPPAVHALAHAMNQALGNVGRTVVYTTPIEAAPVESARVPARPRRRHGRRQGRSAADRRRQSGLHRAGRSAFRRRDGEGAAARAPESATTTRRQRCATGRFPRRTSSKPGATRAATTAPSRSSSR